MKAVTDKNLVSSPAQIRVESFNLCIELVSFRVVEVILEGKMYGRLKSRLEEDHQVALESLCRIDNSAKDVTTYDVIGAIKWIAKSESKSQKTVIIGENDSYFSQELNENLVFIKPSDFVYKVKKATELYEKKLFSSFDDALTTMLFVLP